MHMQPKKGRTLMDFTGEDYQEDVLPETASDGDTCEVCWPGGSGWYTTGYKWSDGQWQGTFDTSPWQMHV